jgi:UDP-N-acetylmuramoyl-L-alanyl-D-glutamate--2,6-diaminopimelate ligase
LQLTDLLQTNEKLSLNGVTSDSRQVKKNYLFAALPGTKQKGSEFIEDAIHHGANIILADKETKLPDGSPDYVQIINSENPRRDFAKIAAKFYRLQPKNIVAVTGTSGKTSTVSFVQQLWHLSGLTKCASLGTLGLRGPGMRRYGSLTTPDTQNLHAELADLAAVGIDHLAMEASSHGLDQYRLDGVKIKAAAYTNLSRDHLDYHKSMDEYFDAKSRLFSELLQESGTAVINADDDYATKLIEICKRHNHKIITFGQSGETIKLIKRIPKPDGQDIEFTFEGKKHEITLPLVGEFQVMNAFCALGLVLSQDNDPEKYIPLLEKLRGVPGRLQLVSGLSHAAVYVDYAHKPAALEAILKTLRPHTENNLVCVFGCGGNRDPGKRGLMGRISNELADKVIVTDDNPRYEEPATIRAQILEEVPKAIEIADRAQAIQKAVEELEEGDVLVVAGKGHEQGQIVAETVHIFDDVEEVKKAIEKIKK